MVFGIFHYLINGIAWYCIVLYCVVGFGARAVSRKTPIYFIYYVFHHISDHFQRKILFLPILQKKSWNSVRRLFVAALVTRHASMKQMTQESLEGF